MITVTIEKRYGASGATSGATTVRASVSAPTIERAIQMAGPNARVEFPIAAEAFFAPVAEEGVDYVTMTYEQVEQAYDAGLPGSHDAYLDRLKDDLGPDEFELYTFQNCLV